MANHLTPDELADRHGMERDEVVAICVRLGIPIFHGRVDKTLFAAGLRAGQPPERGRAAA